MQEENAGASLVPGPVPRAKVDAVRRLKANRFWDTPREGRGWFLKAPPFAVPQPPCSGTAQEEADANGAPEGNKELEGLHADAV
jgi:hypothetical protein